MRKAKLAHSMNMRMIFANKTPDQLRTYAALLQLQSEFRKPAAFLYSQDACMHSCTHAHAHTYAHAQDQGCFVRELFLYHVGEILVPKRNHKLDQRHLNGSLEGPELVK